MSSDERDAGHPAVRDVRQLFSDYATKKFEAQLNESYHYEVEQLSDTDVHTYHVKRASKTHVVKYVMFVVCACASVCVCMYVCMRECKCAGGCNVFLARAAVIS
jgi:hypothetical protein